MSAKIDHPRIGIVGAGNIASLNVAGYLEDERCQVAAVCDPVEGRAAAAAERWGAPASYTDLDAMLADPDIDAVEILTPTNLHHDHVLAALAAGKHVSCQKPLANSVTEARAMAAAAEEAGLILRVSECFRHYPPLEQAKRLIAEGAIGKPSQSAHEDGGGSDRLRLPGRPASRRLRLADDLGAAPAATCSTT